MHIIENGVLTRRQGLNPWTLPPHDDSSNSTIVYYIIVKTKR